MQLVMERVDAFPSTRIQQPVPDLVDTVYQEAKMRGPGDVWLALRHEKRTPLDDISRKLRARGCIRTMVAIERKDEAGEPETFALYCEWNEDQQPYQSPPRRRRDRSE